MRTIINLTLAYAFETKLKLGLCSQEIRRTMVYARKIKRNLRLWPQKKAYCWFMLPKLNLSLGDAQTVAAP
jgi:hypothetical protein